MRDGLCEVCVERSTGTAPAPKAAPEGRLSHNGISTLDRSSVEGAYTHEVSKTLRFKLHACKTCSRRGPLGMMVDGVCDSCVAIVRNRHCKEATAHGISAADLRQRMSEEMDADALEHLSAEAEKAQALEKKSLELYYQSMIRTPII